MILPTRRGVYLMAAGLPLLLVVLPFNPQLWNWGLLWALIAAALLLIDLLLTPTSRFLELDVEAPSLLYIGDSDPLWLTVTGGGFRKDQDAQVSLGFSDLIKPQPMALLQVGPQPRRFEVPLTPLQRGLGRLETVHLRWLGPLGLMARQITREIGTELPIIPNTRAVARAAPNLALNEDLIGVKQERRRGEGSEFVSLKEFGSGMDRRRIDWKRSARHGKLLAKEFDTERNHQIVFGFDCGQLMGEPIASGGEPITRLDAAINSALMLAHVCLRAGDRIGLFAFDAFVRQMLDPMGGARAFTAFAQQAGRIAQSPHESNYTLALTALGGQLQRRSLIILFSEFIDTTTSELMIDHLSRLARRHLLLFVTFTDPVLESERHAAPRDREGLASAVVAQDLARERKLVLERLRRAGLLIIETEPEKLSSALIERYAAIRAREMI